MTRKDGKPSNSSITFKDIKRQNKASNKMSTHILEYDRETNTNKIIKYYETFSESKIEEILTEAHENIKRDEEKSIGFLKDDNTFLSYVYFLIAVRTTNLTKSVPRELEKQIPLMNELLDNGLFRTIFDDVLDSVEVEKIFERLVELNVLGEQIGKIVEASQGFMNEEIENQEIFNTGNLSYRNVLANNPDEKRE